jgi:hypothetical protein
VGGGAASRRSSPPPRVMDGVRGGVSREEEVLWEEEVDDVVIGRKDTRRYTCRSGPARSGPQPVSTSKWVVPRPRHGPQPVKLVVSGLVAHRAVPKPK